jgi:Mg2+/citrate symporter
LQFIKQNLTFSLHILKIRSNVYFTKSFKTYKYKMNKPSHKKPQKETSWCLSDKERSTTLYKINVLLIVEILYTCLVLQIDRIIVYCIYIHLILSIWFRRSELIEESVLFHKYNTILINLWIFSLHIYRTLLKLVSWIWDIVSY